MFVGEQQEIWSVTGYISWLICSKIGRSQTKREYLRLLTARSHCTGSFPRREDIHTAYDTGLVLRRLAGSLLKRRVQQRQGRTVHRPFCGLC